MSKFSTSESSCRVDFFKPSGKWYTTEALEFSGGTYKLHPIDALKQTIHDRIPGRYSGMTAVCLEPYVENSFPVMIHNIG